MSEQAGADKLSVLVPVLRGHQDLPALHRDVCARLDQLGVDYELIYLLGSSDKQTVDPVRELFAREPGRVRVLQFSEGAGESAMLVAGFERARGRIFLTLPGRLETDLAELGTLLDAVRDGSDLALASRGAGGSTAARAQSRLFNRLISRAAGSRFRDVASATRAIRREVIDEIPLYGDYHRYLPLLAERLGFSVSEVPANPPRGFSAPAIHSPRVYFLRALDLLSVLFISRFTRYPLRLFGGVGSVFAAIGGALLLVVGIQRLFGTPLANRPLLVLATLLVGLGVQAFTIGLLGELILFFHARSVRDYRIVAVYDAGTPPLPARDAAGADQNSV